MYIDRIETFPCLYKVEKPYGDANGLKKYRVIYLIKITTRSGYIGWGECIDWLPTLHKGFQERIIPYLLHKKATDHHKLVRVISKWHQRAATGVSMALTEIMARKANLSICDLWGGAFHNTIPLYASFQSYADDVNWQMNHSLSHVGKTLQEGYQMIKIKIGGRSIQEDQEHVQLIQQLVGSTAKIAVDANQSYDLATSRHWCDFLSKWDNILWFEEPMPVDRTADYQRLRSFSTIPIAGGENLTSSIKFLPLFCEGAVDIITPDTMHEEGIDGFRDTMQIGRNFGIRTSPHAFDGALSRIYAMLALACSPPWNKMSDDDIEPLEWDAMDNPFTTVTSIRPEGGALKVPSGIGLGVELDLDRIDHYLWDGSTYI